MLGVPRYTRKFCINDYTAFGSVMLTRSFSSVGYRFGFNGKEKEADGTTDNYDFGARIYDGRLGRWLGVDPMRKKYTEFSTYNFALNNPLVFLDFDGADIILGTIEGTNFGKIYTALVNNSATFNEVIKRFESAQNLTYSMEGKEGFFKGKYKGATGYEGSYKIAFNQDWGDVISTMCTIGNSAGTLKPEPCVHEIPKGYYLLLTEERSTSLNQLGQISAFIHETFHAVAEYDYDNNKLTEEEKSLKPHELLLTKYYGQMQSVLSELNTSKNWGLTQNEMDHINMIGMEGNKVYNEWFKKNYEVDLDTETDKEKIKSAITKCQEYQLSLTSKVTNKVTVGADSNTTVDESKYNEKTVD